jgi:hypothetical protein
LTGRDSTHSQPLRAGWVRTTQGAFSSAFSLGPGYEPEPLNPLASYRTVDHYFLDLRAKTHTKRDRVVTGRGQIITPNATTVAQTALGWWERHLGGEAIALANYLTHTDALLSMADRVGDRLLWRYEIEVPKYRRAAPWFSSMAQGQAASVLVRAYLATGQDRYADAALSALRILEDSADPRGLVIDALHGPVLEECPSDPPSQILNGWVFTLWALWETYIGLGETVHNHLFERSARALERTLPDYDLGWWTRYSLFPRPDDDLAKPAYHRIHADQMEAMYRLTGSLVFHDAHLRWADYDRPANRARAVAVKGTGVVLDRLLARA